MFVSKKKYQAALDKIEHLEKSLAEAQNLKFVFEKLTEVTRNNVDYISTLSGCISAGELVLPDDVPRYVDDYYGGRVIKQEATRLVKIDSSGKTSFHYTAKNPDYGYSYRLERLK